MNLTITRQRGETFAGYSTLEVFACSVCGVTHAIPELLADTAREDHQTSWRCPNGHSQYFPGTTDAEKLKQERRRHEATKDLLRHEELSHRATRGQLTRARNEKARLIARVANGVCPCCNRTFKQLARHMTSQHPEYLDKE